MTPYKTAPIMGILLLLFIPLVYAQNTTNYQVLSLEDIWEITETNNRELKLSSLKLQESHLKILEAKDQLLPSLSLVGDAKLNSNFLIYEEGLFSSPQDVPIKDYGYSTGYNLNFNLFNGGKGRRNVLIKKKEEEQNYEEADLQKLNIKYRVAVAYYDLYKSLHFYDFIEAEIETQKKQLSLIKSLYQNGTVLKSDVLRTSVKLSQLELNLSNIGKKIEIAKQRLNILMGRDSKAELTIDHQETMELIADNKVDYNDYIDIAFNKSPECQIVSNNIKLSELNVNQVKAMRLPKISLYSNYNYTYPQISFYPYSNNLWGFGQTGIKIQYSIDNLYKSTHAVARAQIATNQAKEAANIKKDDILIQVKEAYLQQQQALESVKIAKTTINKTNETVRVIRNSYLNQESLLTDLLEAENTLLEAKFYLTTAQTNVRLAHIKLLAIIGTL